ncbi:MAG: MFS transporter [Litoreibacter sp.]
MKTGEFLRSNFNWLLAGFLMTFASSFGQTFFISLFAGDIRSEFGLSHGAWGGIYMISTLASAAVMVWTGALTDTVRVRSLCIMIFAGFILACIAMSGVRSIWLLFPIIFTLRLSGQGMLSHISGVAMSRWFVAARGRALAFSGLGYSVGEALLPIIFVTLITWIGWRGSWLIAATILMIVGPVVLYLLRSERTPQSQVENSQSMGLDNRHWTRSEVLRLPLFLFILPLMTSPSTFGTSFFFQQVHYVEIIGIPHSALAALFPLFTIVSIGFMILSGWLIDQFGTSRIIPLFQLPMAVGFLFFSAADSAVGVALGMICFGMTSGMNATIQSALWAEFFGTKHLGSIKAMAVAFMVLGSAIGPGLTGWLIDQGVTFPEQMPWITGYFIFSSAMAAIGIGQVRSRLPRAS